MVEIPRIENIPDLDGGTAVIGMDQRYSRRYVWQRYFSLSSNSYYLTSFFETSSLKMGHCGKYH
jgi:hypothetical protein